MALTREEFEKALNFVLGAIMGFGFSRGFFPGQVESSLMLVFLTAFLTLAGGFAGMRVFNLTVDSEEEGRRAVITSVLGAAFMIWIAWG